MTLQRRIGIVFFTLSLITVVGNFITINRDGSMFNILTCSGYLIVFSITVAWESKLSKILQISCFLIAAFFSLMIDSNKMFGTSILIIEILVLYSYGFYRKNIVPKVITSLLVLFAILFITMSEKNEAIMVFMFVSFISGSIFMILFDELKRVYNKLDESMGIADKAIQLIKGIAGNAGKQ